MGAAVIVAAGARRELERTLEAFRVADATAAERAQTMERLGLTDSRTVRRLLQAGVIIPGPSGNRVYLSEVAFAAYNRGTAKRAAVLAAVAGVLAVLGGIVAYVIAARAGRPVP